jgi:hypothetical protein
MRKALRRFWWGLLEMLDYCECGGRYQDRGYKSQFCDRCDRRQFDEDIKRYEALVTNMQIDKAKLTINRPFIKE